MSDDDLNLGDMFTASGLDDEAVAAMNLTADTLGPAIMAGLGNVELDDIKTTEITLVRLLVDDTFSITQHKCGHDYVDNSPQIIQGHNLVLDSLSGAKSAGSVLISCQYITEGEVLYPFMPLPKATRMTPDNYAAIGGYTPLYDMTAVTLSSVVAKMSELEDAGITVRGVTYVITDGADNSRYSKHDAASVSKIVRGLLNTESHIVGAVGIDDGFGTDFRQVFKNMGIQDRWILTPGNSEAEIRRAFNLISQSAVQASQASGAFSQTALGGFGN